MNHDSIPDAPAARRAPLSGAYGVVIALLAGTTLGGGVGTVAGSGPAADRLVELTTEVKTLRTEVIAKLEHLSERDAAFEARLQALEEDLREHEKKGAHDSASLRMDELRRRIEILEGK